MEQTKRYPLDFDSLYKGDEVSVQKLAEIIPHPPGSDEYRFAVLSLSERIVSELSERGIDVVVVQRKGALRLLTDTEASKHCYNEAIRGHKLMGRNLGRTLLVDQTTLTEEDRRIHDSRINVVSRMYQAAKVARREAFKLDAQDHRPFLPSRLAGESEDHEEVAASA